jgi:hypothetical protein
VKDGKMMTDVTANEYQIGGKHYKTKYEHWDLVLNTRMGYLEGNATRYIVRWRKKNGTEDLRKAMHYVNKLIEWAAKGHNRQDLSAYWINDIIAEVTAFSKENKLGWIEQQAVQHLAAWTKLEHLEFARSSLIKLLEIAEDEEPRLPISDPEPVPLTEENHYSPRVGQLEMDDED